jgi:hypothetical protein
MNQRFLCAGEETAAHIFIPAEKYLRSQTPQSKK